MRFYLCLLMALSFSLYSQAQDHDHRVGRKMLFPDIPGYKTLKCDLHQHTVFSDGKVWPSIRVTEALMDGLDAISLTEHLEYQPHSKDIPHPDRNRSHELALAEAKDHKLLIIRGSEITRRMPPGHSNAIFIEDANKLLIKDSIEVFREANRQGAFVFWNHPNWINQRPDGIATLTDVHRFLLQEKLIHGIEVVNEHTFSDEALQIALDHNLTIMGTSDIHKLIDWEFKVPRGGHRPITLVFSKDSTVDGVKEGLVNRRTVVSFNDMLIGREEFLQPLIRESLVIKSARYLDKSQVLVITIENRTGITFTLQNRSEYSLHSSGDLIQIKPGDNNVIEVKTRVKLKLTDLVFEILNATYAPRKHPVLTWTAVIAER